jgi:hypothetical protein
MNPRYPVVAELARRTLLECGAFRRFGIFALVFPLILSPRCAFSSPQK